MDPALRPGGRRRRVRQDREPRARLAAGAQYFRATDLAGGDLRLDRSTGEGGPSCVVIDDVCRLSPAERDRLFRGLAALGSDLRICLTASRPLPPAARAALRGPVFERGPADLSLAPPAVARVLREEHGIVDAALASTVGELTGGWPALVHLAGAALAQGCTDVLAALSGPGTPAATWLREEVLADLPPGVVRALDLVADLDPLSADLLGRLRAASPDESYDWLRRTGLVLPHPRCRSGPDREPGRLVPVVAAVLVASRRGRVAPGTDILRLRSAAAWYERNAHPLAAALALVRAGCAGEVKLLVERRSEEMLAAGGAADLVALLGSVAQCHGGGSAAQPKPGLQRVLAGALRMSGDVPGARRAFAPLVERAHRVGWDAGLAWRVAMTHYLQASYRAALDVLQAVSVDESGPLDRDQIELLACRANVLAMLGAQDAAAAVAARAVSAAEGGGDPRAVAAAHLAAANACTGDRKEAHLGQAGVAAEGAGDVVQAARVLLNQAYALLAAARYSDARRVAAEAVEAAERGSPPGILVAALHNLGVAFTRLGSYDEAAVHLDRSLSVCRRLGLQRTSFGLWGLAEIHRQLGRREQGRAAFAEAVGAARAAGEVQVLVPALIGLARLLLEDPVDIAQASTLAEEAERLAPPEFASPAATARGWVALAGGQGDEARRCAARAVAAARDSCAMDALAEAMELSAAADPDSAPDALVEALGIWQAAGAGPAADRVRVLLGRLPGSDGEARSAAREARRRLLRLGIGSVQGGPLATSEGPPTAVEVRVLGRFEVLVGGRAVPMTAWRSRQARTLVKILAARRGRTVTRGLLCELLWSEDEPARTAHRLSVLLSVVRGVLDPERAWPADHYICADLTGLSLDLTHVTVDVEHLLQDAALASLLLRDGDHGREAAEILAEVAARYRGEAFEDEPYEQWADGLREEARAACLRCLRQLADLRRRTGEHQDAIGLPVRLLVTDPYDEPTHRALVGVLARAGRHGEARRAFDRWAAAMRSIDAPSPDPAVLRSRAAGALAPARRLEPVLTPR